MSMKIYRTVENAKIFSTSLTSDTPRFTSSQFTVRSPLSYPLLWKRIVHINRCLQDLERERERRKVGLLTHEICIKSCECRASHVSSQISVEVLLMDRIRRLQYGDFFQVIIHFNFITCVTALGHLAPMFLLFKIIQTTSVKAFLQNTPKQ